MKLDGIESFLCLLLFFILVSLSLILLFSYFFSIILDILVPRTYDSKWLEWRMNETKAWRERTLIHSVYPRIDSSIDFAAIDLLRFLFFPD